MGVTRPGKLPNNVICGSQIASKSPSREVVRRFGNLMWLLTPSLPPLFLPHQRELAEYYYHWKKTTPGLTSRNTRRQRKQTHIRLSRMMMKSREITPEREYSEYICTYIVYVKSDRPHSCVEYRILGDHVVAIVLLMLGFQH